MLSIYDPDELDKLVQIFESIAREDSLGALFIENLREQLLLIGVIDEFFEKRLFLLRVLRVRQFFQGRLWLTLLLQGHILFLFDLLDTDRLVLPVVADRLKIIFKILGTFVKRVLLDL